MSLAFLSKKNFNPSNIANQKRVWEAEQRKALNKKKVVEREDQLKREREDLDIARVIGGSRGSDEASLRFMYSAPPGMPEKEKETTLVQSSRNLSITDCHPGDDEAAAKFRLLLASKYDYDNINNSSEEVTEEKDETIDVTSNNETGTSKEIDTRTNLEKAVGKRDGHQALTLQEQIARFPQLKDAPMAKGMNATNVHVKFNPMSGPLRNVRCLTCKQWGHSRGDRECKLSGWDPFNATSTSPSNPTIDHSSENRNLNEYNSDSSSDSSNQNKRKHRKKRKKKYHHKDHDYKSNKNNKKKRKRRHNRSRSRS